ncbi:MAG TPA: penicillin acylase family protein, partial [Spirochaetes bacterium]|nr:penicillin acylase family protein [Spirochaetota bacterium]
MNKRWYAVPAILIFLLTNGCALLQPRFQRSVPAVDGTVRLPGLKGEAAIRRDALGVPFIEASNEDDLFYAAGYAQASDRLWQMVIMKMTIQGRLCEITGPDMLPIDIFMRTLNVKSHIAVALKELDGRSRRILSGYARGVNAYIKTHPDLPPEFTLAKHRPEEWKEEDSLYIFAMLNLFLSFNFMEELNYLVISQKTGSRDAAWLFPVYPDEAPPFEETAKLDSLPQKELIKLLAGWTALRDRLRDHVPMNVPASNNWAVAPRKTRAGKTLLANDTHLVLA